MKACITDLPVGTRFLYKTLDFEVVDRKEYPFIECKCHTEPNDYEGLNVLFTNFEKVEVPDGTRLYKREMVQLGKNYYGFKETLE